MGLPKKTEKSGKTAEWKVFTNEWIKNKIK